MRSHPHQSELRASSAGPTLGSRLHSHPIPWSPNDEPHVIDIGRPAPGGPNHYSPFEQDELSAGLGNTESQPFAPFRTPRRTRISGMTSRRNAFAGHVSPCTPECQFCSSDAGDATPFQYTSMHQYHATHNTHYTPLRSNVVRPAHGPRPPRGSIVNSSDASAYGRQTL
ncbi:MAG: hypothetical protein FE78DRAFT_514554 [Acidomyces sp. 'richmondensis']|nr:MAG: hypothetical protein FE78DRAFT_514554 [Acidomyces sp. 'richmondensis']